jgi:anti-sigma factor RsiW
MSACDEIKLLLGPFDDGELEPHEMEDVAFHVVSCRQCKSALDDYRALGLALRDSTAPPVLDGFTQAVQARIEQMRVPLRVRVVRRLDSIIERLGTVTVMGTAAAVAAVLTAVLVSPYARGLVSRENSAARQVATKVPETTATQTQTELANENSELNNEISSAETVAADDSQAVVSRLEADSPSVALWNEPRSNTTVIWVPDQP